jgi:hypothetical protein
MWNEVDLGIVRERSALWANMEEEERGRRARTLDRPHKMNPDAWTNYRASIVQSPL